MTKYHPETGYADVPSVELRASPRWKVVDAHGEDVMTADAVAAAAKRERTTPRQIAQREASLLVNVEAGDAPVYAVRA